MPEFDGIYEVRVFYTTQIAGRSLDHRLTFDVQPVSAVIPGLGADEISVQGRGGAALALDGAVDAVVGLIWANTGTGTSQPRYELWRYEPEPSKNAQFITAWEPLSTLPGGVGGAIPAQQMTWTFRTFTGGVCRIQLMEGNIAGNSRTPVSAQGGTIKALSDYLTGVSSPVIGRDNSFLLAGINFSYGENEKLSRKRFRSQ